MAARYALLFLLGLAGASQCLADTNPYLAELLARAREKNLAARVEWRNLLHYKPNLVWPGVHSLADDPGFFNAPTGKTDPQAELEATLTSFFRSSEESDTHQPPACRFIARHRWLTEELGFDESRLPPEPCRRFRDWRAALNPHEVTLVFAAAYLNNPASMYGHTLLRIDARDQDERTRLLAYAINYAANTPETSGLVFAAKGLFGGYPGQFSIAPYYLKVREYSDMENRDLWEYRLDLTPEEIERLLMHIWELGPTYFDYYFFDENCSYHLLSAFEVARPTLSLTDRFRWWAIPSDTVGAVAQQPGLVREAVYRPSAATLLRERLRQLSAAEKRTAKGIAERRLDITTPEIRAYPPTKQAAVLETAYEFASYRLRKEKAESGVTEGFLRELLLARSALPSTPAPQAPAPSTRPEQGHATSRLDLGAGREAGRDYLSLRFRPTYHDILDAEAGYNRGAQIEFFSLSLRRYEDESVRVEEFRPLDILSVSPRDDFFAPWSWKVGAGAVRRRLATGAEPLVTRLETGVGLTWAVDVPGSSLFSLFADGRLDVESSLERGYAFELGPSLRWLVDVAPGWRAQLAASHLKSAIGQESRESARTLSQHWTLGRDHALRLELSHRRELGESRRGAQLSWLAYF